jgi:hypothetical protein
MSFLKLIPLLILTGAIGVFADTSIINNAPWWVNAVLAFVGAGALGGGGVWAWLGNLIGQKNKSIQFARNFINDLCLLLVAVRESIIGNPKIVELWNRTFTEGADGMKQIKFLADKAPLLTKLLINSIPSAPPILVAEEPAGITVPLVTEKKDPLESGNAISG